MIPHAIGISISRLRTTCIGRKCVTTSTLNNLIILSAASFAVRLKIENWMKYAFSRMSCDAIAGQGIDAKNNWGTRLRFRSERAKKSRNDRSIQHQGEFLVLSFREASRVGQESVHAPPARGPQALDRRLKSRIMGETKRSTAGCTVNVVGTFSSAALYSPGWNGWIEIEKTIWRSICAKGNRKKKRREKEAIVEGIGFWWDSIFFRIMRPKCFNYVW